MIGLVDTTVLVDFLRDSSAAKAWLVNQAFLGIAPLVYMEVIAGATSRTDRQQAQRLLDGLTVVHLTASDQDWAIQQHLQYAPSHNVGILDCLIASVSQRLQLPLYTANLKHFAPLLGSLAVKPY